MTAFDELQRIRLVALRASEIVRELMIYAGHETATFEPLDISSLVNEILHLIKFSISKHSNLETSLPKNLPAVRANAAQMRRVVMNLVTNASEAIGDRGGFIRVSARQVTLPDGDYVRLEVSDTGSGMDAETRARIFDPFFTTKFVGRGLGLAVVQGIVRSHGGSILLTSAPGDGTTFSILFPSVAQPATAEKEKPDRLIHSLTPPVTVAVAEQETRAHGAVLLVEDESTIRLTVSRMLRKRGLSVLEAPDGSAAIQLLRTTGNDVAVILLDVTIPGNSSREVFEEARRLRPNMKVILTTAYSQESAAVSLDWPLFDGFIRKPYKIGDLMELIGEVLAREQA
jgi:CheY-like chemotaxis protein/two-component sensor histidine kinase